MPVTPTYPGVYIEEIPSGVRTITGVATSITAFVGQALSGPTDEPLTINNFGDFERIFGGLSKDISMGYAVRDFFLNGGSQAIIVRLFETDTANGADPARTPVTVGDLTLEAAFPGASGMNLRAAIDTNTAAENSFNLIVRDVSPNGRSEKHMNLSVVDDDRRIDKVLATESRLVRWQGAAPTAKVLAAALKGVQDATKKLADEQKILDAMATDDPGLDAQRAKVENARKALNTATLALSDPVSRVEQALADARKTNPSSSDAVKQAQQAVKTALEAIATSNGLELKATSFTGPGKENAKQGLYALRKADLFNILCIPPYTPAGNVEPSLIAEAAVYCEKRRAMLLVDPPSGWIDKDAAKAGVIDVGTNSKNAALFFPRLIMADPLRDNRLASFVPSGAVAGIFARTDTQRGVWKAPAGLEATLVGVTALSVLLTDAENGELNPLGINCLRTLQPVGRVVWGSRTLQGDDRLASEWKYIPVRRTALFIEESLYRGTQWVVFEPNDEPLWAQIRLNVGAFMHNMFRQGAFQGQTPRDAYFVKCDKETTTQNDINLGIVNVIVGFAPLKPAEFVIIKLQQIAGQVET
ncbi:MAG: phage tail sheath C-terminal domain-containing protein [Roseiflexaceae bacterium]